MICMKIDILFSKLNKTTFIQTKFKPRNICVKREPVNWLKIELNLSYNAFISEETAPQLNGISCRGSFDGVIRYCVFARNL